MEEEKPDATGQAVTLDPSDWFLPRQQRIDFVSRHEL
jgi:hypothetical protein